MIDYSPFWETLKEKNETWYSMSRKHGVADSTLSQLRHNKHVSTQTLNDLCRILNCNIADLVQYIASDDDQIL